VPLEMLYKRQPLGIANLARQAEQALIYELLGKNRAEEELASSLPNQLVQQFIRRLLLLDRNLGNGGLFD